MVNILVDKKQENLKLDKFLLSKYPKIQKIDLYKFIKKKEILVNNKKIDNSYTLKNNDVISFSEFIEKILLNPKNKKDDNVKFDITENNINLFKNSIIFENEDIVAINKPYDLPVQAGTGIKTSIANIIKEINKKENKTLKLVHRLDRTTTGVLIIAKNLESSNKLTDMFKTKNNIEKIYLAVVNGKLTKENGIIGYPLIKKVENNVEKVYRDDKNGKQAITKYKVLKYSEKYNISLVEIQILTGRTHQIRVHFKEIGHSILGDKKYSNFNDLNLTNKIQLHSYKTNLILFENKINLLAKIPTHMEKIINLF